MDLPLRPELRGLEPYGAPQLDVPVLLNVNENPYSPPPAVVDAITRRRPQGRREPQPVPGPRRRRPAHRPRALSGAEARVDFLRYDNIWAANGSNEVMLHLHQAFAGPGRIALSFAPTYSMYPEYCARLRHDLRHAPAPRRLRDRRRGRRRRDRGEGADARARREPQQPHGTSLPLDDVRAIAGRGRRGSWRVRRRHRRGVRGVSPHGRAERGHAAARARRTSPSRARCRRRSRSRAGGSATSPRAPRSSTRCGSCACRTT